VKTKKSKILGLEINPNRMFSAELQEIKSEMEESYGDIQPLRECTPFSPQAYDAISALILNSLLTCIEQIDILIGESPYQLNLGLILYKELLMELCDHYFKEYERINNFDDNRQETGNRRVKISAFVDSQKLAHRVINKARRMSIPWIHKIKSLRLSRTAPRVGWVGKSTVPWYELGEKLLNLGIIAYPLRGDSSLNFPFYQEQIGVLREWVADIYDGMLGLLHVDDDMLQPLDFAVIELHLDHVSSTLVSGREKLELLVTGTLGILQTRLVALYAQSRGIPVMTIHHGSHHKIFDEPRLYLYEDILPDALVDYGSVKELRSNGEFGLAKNLSGRSIYFFSRPDSVVQDHYTGGVIDLPEPHEGIKIVFFASSGWEQKRFGPHRDIHPYTYLTWQRKLLNWLEKQFSHLPFIRPHPKRISTSYDVKGYPMLEGDLGEVIRFADVFVLDRPTSTLSYLAATNKPILFFDPLLIRVFPRVIGDIKRRCHYAQVDIMAPKDGFAKMEADLGRLCTHAFVPKYCLTKDPAQSEVSAIAEAVAQVVFLPDE